jgi:hypothetical protein
MDQRRYEKSARVTPNRIVTLSLTYWRPRGSVVVVVVVMIIEKSQ